MLSATDVVDRSLSGLSVTGFAALSLVVGFVALFSPLVFSACRDRGQATYGGLILAACLTSAATVGELSTLSIMLHRDGNPRIWGFVAMVLAWSALGTYIWRSVRDLVLRAPADDSGTTTPATTSTSTTSAIM